MEAPLIVSIHCRYKTCKEMCGQRKRGRHCPKQKKMDEFLEENK
jgi:hypothetical protein